MSATLLEALGLIAEFDLRVVGIVLLSLKVSLAAVLFGTALGLPLGALVAVARFPGRPLVVILLNALMGLPSVVVGVLVYLALSRSGPFGSWGLLYSPSAMVIAQTVLVVPLIASLTRQIVEDAWSETRDEFRLMGFNLVQSVRALLYDCRHSLLIAVLAGVGRAMSEVGAVMIVGGNIDQFTRVMTTSIALETAKGDLALAIALGVVLLAVILLVNATAYVLRHWAARRFA